MRGPMLKVLKFAWQLSPNRLRTFVCFLLALCLPKAQGVRPVSTDPVWIAGFFQEPTGLGEGARLYYREMLDAGRIVYALDLGRNYNLENMFTGKLFSPANCPGASERGTIVLHVNPPLFILMLYKCHHLIRNKKVIGFWNWELEKVPVFWSICERLIDEVRCPTTFTANAVQRSFRKPVLVHPYKLIHPSFSKKTRKFAEDGVVRVLSIFDLGSNFYRKNPEAAIQAFKLAFANSNRAELILKIGSVDNHPKEWALIEDAISDAPNIRVIVDYLSSGDLKALYWQSDIFLSLHRSEGYGLALHEAMLYGLELVATGWSGNMDFMKGPKCHPVGYRLVEVDDPSGFYSNTGVGYWAEADVAEATDILRGVAENANIFFGVV